MRRSTAARQGAAMRRRARWLALPLAAVAAGLPMRPLADTARDTLAWWNSLPGERRETLRAKAGDSRIVGGA